MADLFSNPIIYIVAILLIGGAIWKIASWAAKVDRGEADFRDFVKEIKADIKEIQGQIREIFKRLPPVEITGLSPLGLTDFGRDISKSVGGVAWATRTAPSLKNRVKDLEAFEIQQFCFDHTAASDTFDDEMNRAIEKSAYEVGAKREQVLRVLAIELRDKLLELVGLEAPG